MKAISKFNFSLPLIASVVLLLGQPAYAQKAATPASLKIGYFNLNLVKISCPETAGSETLRLQAESQLKREVEQANRRLQKAQEEKRTPEELKKLTSDIQSEINAKQQALAQLVQTATAQATEKIFQTVNQVAQEKGLDLVIDGAGVYSGGQKVIDNGVDVTADIMKKISPASQLTKSEPAKAAAAAEPKAK
ncbi:MAG: OmpH family outer membrane protein [Candidatus Obscuribacterales bacterium]|jgi:Skp family chaperone for outer membrane proteins